MRIIYVTLRGCDDNTTFPIEIKTEEEYALLKRIAEESEKHSEYSCMPTMELMTEEEKKEEDDYDAMIESYGR